MLKDSESRPAVERMMRGVLDTDKKKGLKEIERAGKTGEKREPRAQFNTQEHTFFNFLII